MRPSTVLVSFTCGILFGLGLTLSGMTNPAKVFGFLDFFGAWDPSLMLVMVGAIGTNAPLTRWLRRRQAPLLQPTFSLSVSALPWRSQVNGPLVLGAALFGVGWGLGGYCPGPAIVSLPTAFGGDGSRALTFTTAMVAGMLLFSAYDRHRARKQTVSTSMGCPPGNNRCMVNILDDARSK